MMKNAITVAILSKEFIERDWDNYTNDDHVFNDIEKKSKLPK